MAAFHRNAPDEGVAKVESREVNHTRRACAEGIDDTVSADRGRMASCRPDARDGAPGAGSCNDAAFSESVLGLEIDLASE
jgi:hypothetical protein